MTPLNFSMNSLNAPGLFRDIIIMLAKRSNVRSSILLDLTLDLLAITLGFTSSSQCIFTGKKNLRDPSEKFQRDPVQCPVALLQMAVSGKLYPREILVFVSKKTGAERQTDWVSKV